MDCSRTDGIKATDLFKIQNLWRFVCHLLVEVGARMVVRALSWCRLRSPFDVLVVDGSRSAGGFELGEQVFGRCRARGDGLTDYHQVGGGVAVAEVPGCRL